MKKDEGEKEKRNAVLFIILSFQTPTSCQYNEIQRESVISIAAFLI
jgi:hypothetical protein